MEYIGYILSFVDLNKCFYSEHGNTNSPFEAKFYFNYDDAIKLKETLEDIHGQNIEVLKVKKTIYIVE